MDKIFRKYWPFFLISLIAAIIYRFWFSLAQFANANFGYFYFKESLASLSYPSVWLGNYGVGQVNGTLFMLPIDYTRAILAMHGMDANILDKLFFLWPFIFVTGISGYLLCRYITKNAWASVAGSMVFSYNTYFLAITTKGHMSLILAAAFAPLGILLFLKALDSQKKIWAALSAFALFIVGSYDFRTFYIIFFLLSFYLIYFSFIENQFEKRAFLKNVYSYLIFCLISFGLNFYWLVSSAKANYLLENEAVTRETIPYSLNILRAISLFHPFWTGGVPKWFDGQPVPFYFSLVPIAAFLGLFLGRKNKKVIFWGAMAIIGIVLSKQTGDPFPDLYYWLKDFLPGFGAFREASKFYFIILISYSVLISAFCQYFLENKIKKEEMARKAMRFLPLVAVSLLFLWNTKPIITGKMETIFVPKNPPQEIVALKNFLYPQKDYFRVLYVPQELEWGYYDNEHPKINALVMSRGDWQKFGQNTGQGGQSDIGDEIAYIMKQDFSDRLLDISSVKYVITDKNNFVPILNNLNYLEKVDFKGKDLVIWENKNFRPHLYLTEEPESIGRDLPYEKLNYQMVTPSQYNLTISHLSKNSFLNFSEKYNPGWKVKIGPQFSWLKAIFDKNYFLAENNHLENEARLNSFYLDIDYLKKHYPGQIKINPDGSVDMKITIFFYPQSYLYLGLVIIISIFAAFLVYLLQLHKRHENKI